MQTHKSKTWIFLGTNVAGNDYFYTGLGHFASVQAATERCKEHGALVFTQEDLGYGLTQPIAVACCVNRL